MNFWGCNLELKGLTEKGQFTGFASTYADTDRQGDRIAPGAFTRTLAEQGAERPLLWSHDLSQPVGLAKLQDTAAGLMVEGSLDLDSSIGRETYSRLKKGIVKAMSIGYQTLREKFEGKVRMLEDIDLYEVSLVTIPANPQALVTAVKSGDLADVRSFERFLRSAGLSARQSKALLASGWKGLAGADDDDGADAVLAWLDQRIAS
ncbi:MAG: HK97 family phage prohead protease [Bryobacterales bacterium]|nr:HK97 family phage prohead protease [Bryobacterales bacterium]